MKRILGILSVWIFIFGLSFTVNAEEGIKVYNRNAEVELSHELIYHNEKYYMHLDDLSKLGISVEKNDNKYTIKAVDCLGDVKTLEISRILIIEKLGSVTVVDGLTPIDPGYDFGDRPIIGDYVIGDYIPGDGESYDFVTLLGEDTPDIKTAECTGTYKKRNSTTLGTSYDTGLTLPENTSFSSKNGIMIKVDDEFYISCDYVGEKLSHLYSKEDDRIDFYTSDVNSVIMEASLKLQRYVVAPEGGKAVTVHTAYKNGEGSTINDFEILASQSVTIPEGESTVDCLLETPADKITDSNIYFIADFGERYLLANDIYDFAKVGKISVYAEQTEIKYTININLPDVDEEDVHFTLRLNDTYEKNGVIKSGDVSTTIVFDGLPATGSYNPKIIFDCHKYRNAVIDDRISVGSRYSKDIEKDYTAQYSRKVICNVSLPDGFDAEEDVAVNVTLSKNTQSGSVSVYDSLTDWSDSQTVVLNNEKRTEQICLYSQTSASKLKYVLEYPVDGLFKYGYLAKDGNMSSYESGLKSITEDMETDVKLIKKKNITVKPFRPFSISIDKDIFAEVVLYYKDGMVLTPKVLDYTETPLIPAGKQYSEFEFEAIEDGIYYLEIINITGDDRLYDSCYYVKNLSSAADRSSRKQITFDDDSILMELLVCSTLSGIVECESPDLSFTVTADCKLYGGTLKLEQTPVNGEFNFKIPEDVDSYTLSVQTGLGKKSYYVSDGVSSENSDDASKLYFVYDEDDDVVLEYIVQNPKLPVQVSTKPGWDYFKFENISDFDLHDLTVYLAYYDKNGRILFVEKTDKSRIFSGGYVRVTVSDSDYKVKKIRAYIWQNGSLLPLGNVAEKTVNTPTPTEQDLCMFTIGSTDAIINCNDVTLSVAPIEKNGDLYLAEVDFEKLGYTVYEKRSTVYIEKDGTEFSFVPGEYEAILTKYRERYDISNPVLKDDGIYIPIISVSEVFDEHNIGWYNDNQSIMIDIPFKDIDYYHPYREAIYAMYYKGFVAGYEDRTIKPERTLTRIEAAVLFSFAMGHSTPNCEFSCEDVQEYGARGYIGICMEEGIFELDNGYFYPIKNITLRDSIIATLKMKDIYYGNYLETAAEHGLLVNIDTENPERDITAAELLQLLYNADK